MGTEGAAPAPQVLLPAVLWKRETGGGGGRQSPQSQRTRSLGAPHVGRDPWPGIVSAPEHSALLASTKKNLELNGSLGLGVGSAGKWSDVQVSRECAR